VNLLTCSINRQNSGTQNGVGVCMCAPTGIQVISVREIKREQEDKILQINFAWEGREF
jgi:hypothetical protein